MAKFEYKFQTLLDLKEQLEEQAKNEFGKVMARLNREKEKLRRIEASITMSIEEFRVISGGRFTAETIKRYNAFIKKMKENAVEQKQVIIDAEEEVEAARQLLVKAVQEREKFEKLEEKEYDKFFEEEKRQDNMIIDELVSYRSGSKSDGEKREKTRESREG